MEANIVLGGGAGTKHRDRRIVAKISTPPNLVFRLSYCLFLFQGHHPHLGAHAKFTDYSFNVPEFLRLVTEGVDHISSHPLYMKLTNSKPPSTKKDELWQRPVDACTLYWSLDVFIYIIYLSNKFLDLHCMLLKVFIYMFKALLLIYLAWMTF